MQPVLKIIKKHPVAMGGYTLYLWFCAIQFLTSLRFKAASSHINGGERIAWGEGVMYGWILLILLALAFTFVMILNAIWRKDDSRFYNIMAWCSSVPVFLLFAI